MTNHTTAVSAIIPTQRYDIGILRDLIYKNVDEFFIEKNSKMTRITGLKSYLKVFPQFKNTITKYVESNKIDFKNETDLIKLTNYCIQLSLVKK
jgi:hypothetical protein